MAESDKDLPKGLVNLTDVHCPITEMDTFGLPYHGLVVNGELTLPNGKIIKYPQPKELSHKSVTYYTAGNYWCTNNGGFYASSGMSVKKYERVYLGSTILVKGKNVIDVVRSKKQLEEDKKNGHTWKNYAYLSGCLREIAGNAIEPGTLNDYGDGINGDNTAGIRNKEVSIIAKMYNQGYWLYNDGTVTWLMRWQIDPTTTTVRFGTWDVDPVRTIRIWVVKPFGAFGLESTSMSPLMIYEGPYDKNLGNRYTNSGHPVWVPFYSADGSVVTVNEIWTWFDVQCYDSFNRYWIPQYINLQWTYDLQMCDGNPDTGMWYADFGELWTWVEIDISGKGLLTKNNLGKGIEAKVAPKEYWYDWEPPGWQSEAWFGCHVVACVKPDGTRGHWWMETWSAGSGQGELRSTWGLAVPFSFYPSLTQTIIDNCFDYGNIPYTSIHQGVSFSESGLMAQCWTGPGRLDFNTVHFQGNSWCPGGISYDIANDKWSTIENSCYV
jgi:hypothetical protein